MVSLPVERRKSISISSEKLLKSTNRCFISCRDVYKRQLQAGFALTGGGGKCTFDNGLGLSLIHISMTVPRPYSCFHLLFCGVGIILVGFLVHILCKKCYKIPYVPFYGCGLVLALGELYKQLFLYQIVNQGRYDWWYFPMQLCSTPMYLSLIHIWARFRYWIALPYASRNFLN